MSFTHPMRGITSSSSWQEQVEALNAGIKVSPKSLAEDDRNGQTEFGFSKRLGAHTSLQNDGCS